METVVLELDFKINVKKKFSFLIKYNAGGPKKFEFFKNYKH